MTKLRTSIVKDRINKKYYLVNETAESTPYYSPTDLIFSMEWDSIPENHKQFMEEIRQKCRKRGIYQVVNLDDQDD